MSEHRSVKSIFERERNCWRVEHADEAAFLIDADAYFKAFVAAAEQAQRSIVIAGCGLPQPHPPAM
jgi:phospholipase D1/2